MNEKSYVGHRVGYSLARHRRQYLRPEKEAIRAAPSSIKIFDCRINDLYVEKVPGSMRGSNWIKKNRILRSAGYPQLRQGVS